MDCPVCGNPTSSSKSRCEFCGAELGGARPARKKRTALVREVNVKGDMPTADVARERMRVEIQTARQAKARVLKVIHGYGSSGQGGVLRSKLRQSLRKMEKQGAILGWLAGEEFDLHGEKGRWFLKRYPELEADHDYKRHNPGITLIGLV